MIQIIEPIFLNEKFDKIGNVKHTVRMTTPELRCNMNEHESPGHCIQTMALERLEPDDGKLSSPVLRGVSGSNTARLPGTTATSTTTMLPIITMSAA